VLCHLLAAELGIASQERNSLVHAALTMNIGMTALQDVLANQADKPTKLHQDAIRAHAVKGAMMLVNLGVTDDNWLDIVSDHHSDTDDQADLRLVPAAARLTRILKVVDRYSAMISPRMSRSGRSATESARSIMANASAKTDEIGHAMVRSVGLYPPGTFVQLDDNELAVVVRRSDTANRPYVAIVSSASGEKLSTPCIHNTADKAPQIRTALTASAVRVQLHHFHILELGAMAAQTP
jgi:HD-GYP domain-containing protein (c-di-GMP phosphodiesterase class II)